MCEGGEFVGHYGTPSIALQVCAVSAFHVRKKKLIIETTFLHNELVGQYMCKEGAHVARPNAYVLVFFCLKCSCLVPKISVLFRGVHMCNYKASYSYLMSPCYYQRISK